MKPAVRILPETEVPLRTMMLVSILDILQGAKELLYQYRRYVLLARNMHAREQPPKRGYLSELRDWVQHVISEAEKKKDFKKKKEFLRLLKDLDDV